MTSAPRYTTRAQSPLEALDPPVRGLIVDGDGVLWKDTQPIGDLAAAFTTLARLGMQVSIVTNNAMNNVEDYCTKLRGFGVQVEPAQIVTAGEATADTLLQAFPEGGALFVAGERGVMQALQARGFEVVTDPDRNADFVAVVAGIDREFSYARLERASNLIRGGVPYYGTNPDPTFPSPSGLLPGAGAMLAAISAASGKQPIVVGKPSPLLFETAARRMQLKPAELLAVGDRLETDIAGGQAFGARTALVLTGVSTRADADAWRPAPTIVAASFSTLLGL